MKAFHPIMRERYREFAIPSAHADHVTKENPFDIARRLSKARSVALDNVYRRKSSSTRPPELEKSSKISQSQQQLIDFYFTPPEEVETTVPDKIAGWMLHTEFNVKEKKHSSGASSSGNSPVSPNFGSECDPFGDVNEGNEQIGIKSENILLPEKLQNELLRSDSILCEVKWDVANCDLLLEVEEMLLPVEKNFISYVSSTFRTIIDGASSLNNSNNNNEETVTVTLHNYAFSEVKTVLEFIYSVNEDAVSDENVASLLQVGDEFKVERLIYQCEKHLRTSKTFNPFIMSHLAKQYHLDCLLEYSYAEMSKMEGVEDTQEFQLLDSIAQNKILKFVLQRYRKAGRTLSQFDVHLCNHHGNDAKNNNCCFRAATYSTENNRTFLVQMEHPDKKLIETYETAFHCDTESLLNKRRGSSFGTLDDRM